MNWGKGLAIFIGLFILSMLAMVYVSFQHSNEMIEDKYYDREVKYQEVINAKEALLPYKNQLKLYKINDEVKLELPQQISSNPIGQIRFLKLDNEKLDKTLPISTKSTTWKVTQFGAGEYIYKLEWENEGKKYFLEDEITFQ